jgi:hypothetical protein
VLAAALMVAYTLLDEALQRRSRLRLPMVCVMLFALSIVLTLLLFAYYAHGFGHPPPLLRLLADSLRFGLPAIFLALIADAQRRALHIDAASHVTELLHAHLGHDETEQQLALLRAQIEPHFLFNVLGNVRRLYRTQPKAGSATIVSLMRTPLGTDWNHPAGAASIYRPAATATCSRWPCSTTARVSARRRAAAWVSAWQMCGASSSHATRVARGSCSKRELRTVLARP